MTIALWITAVVLTVAYLAAGGAKLARSREQLQSQMKWVADATAVQVKVVGALEVIGAFGVILPLATGIAPVTTGAAAVCLAIIQLIAIPIHIRRGEFATGWPVNTFLLLLAAAVAILRFATL